MQYPCINHMMKYTYAILIKKTSKMIKLIIYKFGSFVLDFYLYKLMHESLINKKVYDKIKFFFLWRIDNFEMRKEAKEKDT